MKLSNLALVYKVTNKGNAEATIVAKENGLYDILLLGNKITNVPEWFIGNFKQLEESNYSLLYSALSSLKKELNS